MRSKSVHSALCGLAAGCENWASQERGTYAGLYETDLEIENLPGHAGTRATRIRVDRWIPRLRVRCGVARHRLLGIDGLLEGAERAQPCRRRWFWRFTGRLASWWRPPVA